MRLAISWWLDRHTKRKLAENPEALEEADRAWARLWRELRATVRRDRDRA
jgi:hypothetical protein